MWHLNQFLTNIYLCTSTHTYTVRATYLFHHPIYSFNKWVLQCGKHWNKELYLDYLYFKTGKNGTIRQDEALLRQHTERGDLVFLWSKSESQLQLYNDFCPVQISLFLTILTMLIQNCIISTNGIFENV